MLLSTKEKVTHQLISAQSTFQRKLAAQLLSWDKRKSINYSALIKNHSSFWWMEKLKEKIVQNWNSWDITENCSIDIKICMWPQNKLKNSTKSQASSRANSYILMQKLDPLFGPIFCPVIETSQFVLTLKKIRFWNKNSCIKIQCQIIEIWWKSLWQLVS